MSALLLLQVSTSWASWKLLRGPRRRAADAFGAAFAGLEDGTAGNDGGDDDALDVRGPSGTRQVRPPLLGSEGEVLAQGLFVSEEGRANAYEGMALLTRLEQEDRDDLERKQVTDLRAKRAALKLWCVIACLRMYEAAELNVLQLDEDSILSSGKPPVPSNERNIADGAELKVLQLDVEPMLKSSSPSDMYIADSAELKVLQLDVFSDSGSSMVVYSIKS
ncbi:Hypothetical Protein FCC1311_058762 [Hondaea fermentalgiana]|uniref:Uncharacterized protein n=1 Tax=Hondaea fermentalgiana TaxID=2315210 RepID=A0A2R5GGD4_9STRA|nr:Hypothetical Protein FCC1311_058762 [Hondaea fermentalgiana]|eukprot:GBG29655.1 Hypothetical Protein FCC1311_058762 [Hondaea fermentalgiana]